MDYYPMCWTAKYDEKKLRAYLDAHPGVKYLLGFNEPNFMYQANLTPKDAAAKWPKVDCLALHCYMNWAGSHMWYATDYFYRDLFDPQNETYGKYPSLVELMEEYKKANGHFPRMMLTEFCSWEGDKDGFKLTPESQIDQMTQKVQKMELSDLVEGYAWFMANDNAAVTPYYSIFRTNWTDSELSALGQVYVHMSAFDKEHFYAPGSRIPAKDYVDATTDDKQVRLRPNTEEGSDVPLQVEFQKGSAAAYQIEVPQDGTYKITLHCLAATETALGITADEWQTTRAVTVSTNGKWIDVEDNITLAAGRHTLRMANLGDASFLINGAW